MSELDSITSAFQLSRYERSQMARKYEQEKKEAERTENLNKNFQSIVAEMKEQNRILQKQAEKAELASIEAKKEAKTAKIISIISVVTSILFSLASLIMAILK